MPGWAVERACRVIASQARGEYEPAFPELGAIRERALAIVRLERERRESARLLAAPEHESISPERHAEIMARFRAVLQRRTMPGAKAAAAGERE